MLRINVIFSVLIWMLKDFASAYVCDTAAVFTPDNIRDDENTRYLLGIMGVLDSVGCKAITVLVTAEQTCKDVSCMQNFQISSKVNWRNGRVTLTTVSTDAEHLTLRPLSDPNGNLMEKYDTFVLFGNEKLPKYKGIGKGINFFVCQFGTPVTYYEIMTF
jgi:hypothetical protein